MYYKVIKIDDTEYELTFSDNSEDFSSYNEAILSIIKELVTLSLLTESVEVLREATTNIYHWTSRLE